jgi:cation/acetate symporter
VAARALMLDADPDAAAWAMGAVALLCAVGGGMRSAIATLIAQYAVLLIACLALFLLFAMQRFDAPGGDAYDPAIHALDAVMHGLGLAPAPSPRSIPFQLPQALDDIELMICLMAGTASMPHILMPPLASRSMGEARTSAAWSLLFMTALVFALPTYMMLAGNATGTDLSGVASALTASVAVTAALAGTSVLLVVIGNALHHDVYRRLLAPRAPHKDRMVVARFVMAAAAAAAAYGAATMPFDPAAMLVSSFTFVAAGLFPALVLGIWWSRATATGAVAGMLAGLFLSLLYAGGALGLAAGFMTAVIGSLPGGKPSPRKQAWLTALRAPGASAAPGRCPD